MIPADLRPDLRWLASGFMLMMLSGFGQTFYVAIFAGQLRGELALSNGEFGILYTIGTLASALVLTWAGRLADTVSIRWLGAGVIAGLAVAAAAIAVVPTAIGLAGVFFLLRFFGQGMCTHTAMTAMGRWFNRKRGTAVAVAGLGLPAAEALLPPLAVAGIAVLGWRTTWLVSAGLLAIVAVPVFAVLLRNERHPTLGPLAAADDSANDRALQWTRREVLSSSSFYGLLPGVLAPPFIVTAVFFNQVEIVAAKGWQLSWFAAWFPLLAALHVIASLVTGWLIDRFGARRLLPFFLLPLGAGVLLLAAVDDRWVLPAAIGLIGASIGCSSATMGALWAELYGTLYLGAIRSVVAAAVVFASALAPGLVGLLLDAGIGLESQFAVLVAYCLAASVWMWFLLPRLDRIAAPAAPAP